MARLSEKQIACIEYLSQPKRGGLTYAEVAEEVGIARSTIFEWRKNDAFNEALNREIVRKTADRMPEVLDSMVDNIIETGNAAAFRTMVQMHGMLTERLEIDSSKGNAEDIDDIRAEIERMRDGGR